MTTKPILKLDSFWPYQAVVLGDLVGKHTLKLLKAHGEINLSQWRVIAAIGEQPGRTAAQVVAITPMDKGIVSRAVASLITDGLVKKFPDPNDKRRATLSLTPLGEKKYQAISKALLKTLDLDDRNGADTEFLSKLAYYIQKLSE